MANTSDLFSADGNPLPGSYRHGGDNGNDWNNMQVVSGNAVGTTFATASSFDDNIACTIGAEPNHFIEGIVHRQGGYAPTTDHELELLGRFAINTNSARGYEVMCSTAGASNIVKWNGPLGDFTMLSVTGSLGAPAHGDKIRAEFVGQNITVYKNNVQVMRASDATYTDGNPGIGSFARTGDGVLANLGWQSITWGMILPVAAVGSASATPGTASTVAISLTVIPGLATIVAKIWLHHASATVNSISWSLGSGTPFKVKEVRGSNGVLMSVWAIPAAVAGAGTVTATLSASVLSGGNATAWFNADPDPCPLTDAVSSTSVATPNVLTPTNLAVLDASDGAAANITAGNQGTASPFQDDINNSADPGYLVGHAFDTTGITFTNDSGISAGNAALVAVRIQSVIPIIPPPPPPSVPSRIRIAPTQRMG